MFHRAEQKQTISDILGTAGLVAGGVTAQATGADSMSSVSAGQQVQNSVQNAVENNVNVKQAEYIEKNHHCRVAGLTTEVCNRYKNDEKTYWSLYNFSQWISIFIYDKEKANQFLHGQKENFVKDYKDAINLYAKKYDIPPILLAGVAYNEFGGDPMFLDKVAYTGRSIVNTGKKADKTSFGNTSIQIARVKEMHPDWSDQKIIVSLQIPEKNIELTAEHLRVILDVDYKGVHAKDMSDEHIKIAGARYNRGLELPKDKIKQNTSYGDRIVDRKYKLQELLKE